MSLAKPRRIKKVALLIETTRTYTRELLAGVRRYVATHGPWSTFLELRAWDSSAPAWLRNWDGDGILTRTFTQETSDLVTATGLPAVELRATKFSSGRPFVGMDNAHIGRAVAEHFHESGHRRFGTYSLHSEVFFIQRSRNFADAAHAYGCDCFDLPEMISEHVADWEKSQERLIAWLAELPRPIGVFAANDQLGVHLLAACQRAGVAVPEEVAVVGAENEETLCAFATPTLTSVRFDGEAVGYAAAQLLDRMMEGIEPTQKQILIPPKGIVVRGSSDELVINDPLVAHAARWIRENAARGINVDDLCRRLNTSRSTLDRRMKAALNRTPKEEITRIRFRNVAYLLRETDLTIEVIAEKTGFTYAHYLQAAFKEIYGQTPGEYRRAALSAAPFQQAGRL